MTAGSVLNHGVILGGVTAGGVRGGWLTLRQQGLRTQGLALVTLWEDWRPGGMRMGKWIPDKARPIAGLQSTSKSCGLGTYPIKCERYKLPAFIPIGPQVQLLRKFCRIAVAGTA
jgi:hypothetical protein